MQNPSEWLVIAPKGVEFMDALTQACRGHRNVAKLLYYYLYVARYTVKDKGIDKDAVEFIPVLEEKDQDVILKGLEKYADYKTSKKTLITLNGKLNEYGFVISDGRRQQYQVFWKAVQKAVDNPPPPDAPKLRGKHAPKPKEDGQKVKRSIEVLIPDNDTVKTSIRAQNEGELTNCSFEVLSQRIVDLQLGFNLLTERIEVLSQRIVDLQLEKSQEAARRAELEAKIEDLYKLYKLSINYNINSLTNGGTANAFAPQEEESKEKENNVIELSTRKTSQPSQRKSNKNKMSALSMQPTLPDLDAPPTLEAILQVGDYVRGHALPQKDMKTCREGAAILLQQKQNLRDITKVLVYMSTRDEIRAEFGMKFKDEGYLKLVKEKNYKKADLCNIWNKMDNKLEEIAKLEKPHNKPTQDTPQAQHILPAAAAEPLNETAEEIQERKNKKRLERFVENNPVVFWTTTKDVNTIKNVQEQPIEVLLTWKEMYVQEAIEQYGLTPLDYACVPSHKTGLLSRIAILTHQTVSA